MIVIAIGAAAAIAVAVLWPRSAAATSTPHEPGQPGGRSPGLDFDVSTPGGDWSGTINVRLPDSEVGPGLPAPIDVELTPPQADPYNPATTPTPGQYYQTKSGDMGTRIVRDAYNIPLGDPPTGERVRAWSRVCKHANNAGLARLVQEQWDGALVAQHKAPGTYRRGTGNRFPVVYLPTGGMRD